MLLWDVQHTDDFGNRRVYPSVDGAFMAVDECLLELIEVEAWGHTLVIEPNVNATMFVQIRQSYTELGTREQRDISRHRDLLDSMEPWLDFIIRIERWGITLTVEQLK